MTVALRNDYPGEHIEEDVTLRLLGVNLDSKLTFEFCEAHSFPVCSMCTKDRLTSESENVETLKSEMASEPRHQY
ncbi:hypothetical protein Pmani_025065 [Petrolisthes manimaculis]|uniref:Uncharacterized protein n=1 Tax=Petrolisthes manimaculis TaxID=1843537 RepID=A0AAE1U1J4_9EUCA|nr:hypothetical protein Pmani_025065 [Petrolisthes manimaculis]